MTSRVSGWWYAVAVAPLVLGVAFAVMEVVTTFSGIRDLARARLPGPNEVTLAATHYTLYAEGDTEGGPDAASEDDKSPPRPALACELTEVATGTALALAEPTGTSSYTIGGRSGVAFLAVDVPHAGAYRVACHGELGEDPAVAFSPTGAGTTIVMVLSFVFPLCVALPLMILGIITIHRKRAAAAYFEVVP